MGTRFLPKPLVELVEFFSPAKVTLEDEARFTVDNVLKGLPIINNLELDCLCLVSSDYHMKRAGGIYDAFRAAKLAKYDVDHYVSAQHVAGDCVVTPGDLWTGDAEVCDAGFLNKELTGLTAFCEGCGCEHATKEEEIRCPERDVQNAKIFCDYILHARNGGKIEMTDKWFQKYLRLNKKISKYIPILGEDINTEADLLADKKKFLKSFKANVALFVKDTQRRRLLRRLRA